MAEGYTHIFVHGSDREHLLEVYVTEAHADRRRVRHLGTTAPPRTWLLSEEERLALVVLGQRYLRHEANPRPLSWRQTAEQLAELRPGGRWTAPRVAHLVANVRTRLSNNGVAGLTRTEVGEQPGTTLDHNLIHELMESTTLVPWDLAILDPD